MCTGSANPRVSADMSIDDWRHLLAVALLPHKLFDTSLLLHMENICTNFFSSSGKHCLSVLLHLENICTKNNCLPLPSCPTSCVPQRLTHHFSQTSLLHLENIGNSNDFSIWKSFASIITFPNGKHMQHKSLFHLENMCTNITKMSK